MSSQPSISLTAVTNYLGGHPIITTTLLVCALVQMIYEMVQTIISANAKPLSDYFNVTVTAGRHLLLSAARSRQHRAVEPFCLSFEVRTEMTSRTPC